MGLGPDKIGGAKGSLLDRSRIVTSHLVFQYFLVSVVISMWYSSVPLPSPSVWFFGVDIVYVHAFYHPRM